MAGPSRGHASHYAIKAGSRPALLLPTQSPESYVVDRGFTAIAVAGTVLPLPEYAHP